PPMPAPKFLSGLPKPVLFGLYGAVGGLLGAIVLGEPLWYLLKPPAAPEPPPAPPQIAVSASPEVQVYVGSAKHFTLKIARDRYDKPVTVKFGNLPPSVAIQPITISPDKSEAQAMLVATPDAAPGTFAVNLTAEGEGGIPTAASEFKMRVL